MDMSIVYKTLEKLKANTGKENLDAMIHSDQGVHYTHPIFQQKLQELGLTQSMSRKGKCIDNAPIESFFGHFKDEVDIKSAKSFEELQMLVDNYMYHYNFERYQWNLKRMTPDQYKKYLLAA